MIQNSISRDRRTLLRSLLLAAVTTSLPVAPKSLAAAEVTIVQDGKAAAVLVIPDHTNSVVRYAAEELRTHIKAASGVELEVIQEKEVAKPRRGILNAIYLGACNATKKAGVEMKGLPTDGFVIHSTRSSLYLAGNDGGDSRFPPPVEDTVSSGTLFAVYEWLDRQLDVKWLWPGELGTYIPERKTITSTLSDIRSTPTLISSRLAFEDAPTEHRYKWPSGDTLKDATFLENNRWMRRHRFSRPIQPVDSPMRYSASYYHTAGNWWKLYGGSHPEYFAQRPDGVRAPLDSEDTLVQLCVSNPDVWKQLVDDWLKLKDVDTARPYINGCDNDRRAIDPSCRCPACVALDVPDAKVSMFPNPWHIDSRQPQQIPEWEKVSLSDRYATFYAKLLEEGKKYDPNVKVVGYAYSFYSDPPVRTKLNSDVIVQVVPPFVYPHPKNAEDRFRKLWDGWKATGATLTLGPNHLLLGFCLPYTYKSQLSADFRHALKNGMLSCTFDSLTGMWGVQGPDLYMLARIKTHPELSNEQIMNEYYTAFGSAKETIKEYFDYWESITLQCDEGFHAKANGGWNALAVRGHLVFTKSAFAKGFKLLEHAKTAVAKDSAIIQGRVAYLETWLRHADLGMRTLSSYETWRTDRLNGAKRSEFEACRAKFDAFREAHPSEFLGMNVDHLHRCEPW